MDRLNGGYALAGGKGGLKLTNGAVSVGEKIVLEGSFPLHFFCFVNLRGLSKHTGWVVLFRTDEVRYRRGVSGRPAIGTLL